MPAYLLTYNPNNWHWENLPDLAQAVAAGGVTVESWSTGVTKSIRGGDRIFLLKQGPEPRGIMGSGFAQGGVYEDAHWDGSDGVANYIKVEFNALLDPDEQPILSRSALDDPALAAQHWDPMGSGASIKPVVLPTLEQMWHEHLTSLGLTPADQVILPARREEFARLYQAFLTEYPDTAAGRDHIANYARQREIGRANWETIVEMDARGEDITDAVLWRLLPHIDSENTRRAGAWVHLAPAINKDVKSWFEGAGWTRAEDWPMVARAIFEFVRRCTDDPNDLAEACATFDALPHSKGFQAGMLSPILNALDPEHFALFNSKTRRTLKYFSGAKLEAALTAYPAANAALHSLVEALAPDIEVEQAPDLRTDDLFDMFSHWLVAERKYDFDATRYWKIAPGEQARLWQDSLDGQYISIGWEELGDIRDMTRKDFERRRDALLEEHSEWNAQGMEQVWKFAHIPEGDHIVANRGTSQVLGFGRITGPYYFVPDVEHGHRLPVAWEDTTPRSVDEYGWRRTLIELNRSAYDDLLSAPAIGGTPPDAAPTFGPLAFELLAILRDDPTMDRYETIRDSVDEHIMRPFKRVFHAVAERLPPAMRETLETEKFLFSRFPKNDYGAGGVWNHYWGAFFPKGTKRGAGPQLLMYVNPDVLSFGFFIGSRGDEARQHFAVHSAEHGPWLAERLEERVPSRELTFQLLESAGDTEGEVRSSPDIADWRGYFRDPAAAGFGVAVTLTPAEATAVPDGELVDRITDIFERLYPLFSLTLPGDPRMAFATAAEDLDIPDENDLPHSPTYTLDQCADDTGYDVSTLQRWVNAIERKKQAILYGPPGTGKTFMARRLANHLVGDTTGHVELLQLHPAYAYEDFIQGLRPAVGADGALDYRLEPGRFVRFCEEARTRGSAPSVLILDEINRANLARVFGELMYLLEYRGESIPLAAGQRLSIPKNVRIIGTMNTADRSIALVDHALRRRFAFIELAPNFDTLLNFHAEAGLRLGGLIDTLKRLNHDIADPHYSVGVTFFMVDDLPRHIADIWRMEIEPYLDEYFFAQRDKAAAYNWERVADDIGLTLS